QSASFTFSPNNPAPGQSVQFTDTSNPTPASWAWNFGDPSSGANNTSTLQNPTHVFAVAGTYSVTLTTPDAGSVTNSVTVSAGTGACVPGMGTLCLVGGRFQVTANWTTSTGSSGPGTAVPLSDGSGYFWFFDPTNTEMVVKVLNGCAINNSYWVFAAGLTNVQVNWEVLDTKTGVSYTQVNTQGTPFAPIQATNAFPTSCP
ncbi:MAG TPA: PKD domain-containing protein, partial [Thermoanaerobaculia bacterium]|nr:PKD domain-containing protein [Thermoanaerobaculia bacterium]